MTARYLDGWDNRPIHPDHGRPRPRTKVGAIGEFTRPADCDHPIEARVWPDVRPYVARCHECGLHQTRQGVWMYA